MLSVRLHKHFFSAVDITEKLCTKQGNSSKKSVVYNQDRFQIKSGLLWHTSGILLTKSQENVYSKNELFLKKLLNWAYLYLCYSEISLGNTVHLRTNMAISVHNTYPSKGLFSFLEFFSYLSWKIGGF